jgi:hypothetical protein
VEHGWCSVIGVAVLGVDLADVGKDAVDDARDIDVGFEAARDVVANAGDVVGWERPGRRRSLRR